MLAMVNPRNTSRENKRFEVATMSLFMDINSGNGNNVKSMPDFYGIIKRPLA